MTHRSSRSWLEAKHMTRVITQVWLWVLAVLGTAVAFFAMVYWAVPALFLWLIFGSLLEGLRL